MLTRRNNLSHETPFSTIARVGRAKFLKRVVMDMVAAVGLEAQQAATGSDGIMEATDGFDQEERLEEAGRDGTHFTKKHGVDQGRSPGRLRLGFAMSHNEELLVSTCGHIDSRATMYRSESPSVFTVSIMQYSVCDSEISCSYFCKGVWRYQDQKRRR